MVRARARVAMVRGATSCAMVPPLAPTERDHDTPRLTGLGLGVRVRGRGRGRGRFNVRVGWLPWHSPSQWARYWSS